METFFHFGHFVPFLVGHTIESTLCVTVLKMLVQPRFFNVLFTVFYVTPSTDSSEQPDAKKAKGDAAEEDEGEEYNLADISEGSVTSVRNWVGETRGEEGMLCGSPFSTSFLLSSRSGA